MANISETLKSKAGPLPVWAWGAILGVLVVAGMYWFSSRNSAGGSSSGESEGVALEAYPELGAGSVTRASADGSDSGLLDSVQEFTSNLAWQTFVVARMVAQGYSPLEVQAALENYLNGEPLTKAQADIVNYAIGKYGSPPNGTLGVSPIGTIPTDTGVGKAVPLSEINEIAKLVTPTAAKDAQAVLGGTTAREVSISTGQKSYLGDTGNLYTQTATGNTTTNGNTSLVELTRAYNNLKADGSNYRNGLHDTTLAQLRYAISAQGGVVPS